jgi:hypothetical protein
VLTARGFSAKKLKYDELLSNFDFNFNFRHYTMVEGSVTVVKRCGQYAACDGMYDLEVGTG